MLLTGLAITIYSLALLIHIAIYGTWDLFLLTAFYFKPGSVCVPIVLCANHCMCQKNLIKAPLSRSYLKQPPPTTTTYTIRQLTTIPVCKGQRSGSPQAKCKVQRPGAPQVYSAKMKVHKDQEQQDQLQCKSKREETTTCNCNHNQQQPKQDPPQHNVASQLL